MGRLKQIVSSLIFTLFILFSSLVYSQTLTELLPLKIDSLFIKKNLKDNSIGYSVNDSYEGRGLSGLFLSGEAIYISDNSNGTVSKININTRVIEKESSILDSIYFDLSDLFKYGDSLYVLTSFSDKIFVLDLNLELKNTIRFRKSSKTFIFQNDTLFIASSLNNKVIYNLKTNKIEGNQKFVMMSRVKILRNESNESISTLLESNGNIYKIPMNLKLSETINFYNICMFNNKIVYVDLDFLNEYRFYIFHFK
ncbi:MAG: hypothetical protein LCH54_00880 [Bacteroidetes bacterium]|nr:hypothetical protein [Bacteroidota bacterium]